jgi:hypothetical protein
MSNASDSARWNFNYVRFGGRVYIGRDIRLPLTETDLGPAVAKVRSKVSSDNADHDGCFNDGDANLLDPNTSIYCLKGYRPTFRLAAYYNDNLIVYEATPDTTMKGVDLLDIAGKVQSIGLFSSQTLTSEVATIGDPEQVEMLVDQLLEAPIDYSGRIRGQRQLFLAFHLFGSMAITCIYWLDVNKLSWGLVPSEAFRAPFLEFINKYPELLS